MLLWWGVGGAVAVLFLLMLMLRQTPEIYNHAITVTDMRTPGAFKNKTYFQDVCANIYWAQPHKKCAYNICITTSVEYNYYKLCKITDEKVSTVCFNL